MLFFFTWNNFIKNGSHYGDMIAIPLFALLFYYIINNIRKNKKINIIEYLLLIFSIFGFILDIWYTYVFLFLDNN